MKKIVLLILLLLYGFSLYSCKNNENKNPSVVDTQKLEQERTIFSNNIKENDNSDATQIFDNKKASSVDDYNTGDSKELPLVLSKTRQNEFIALNGRADPQTIQMEFDNYKTKIEPIGWSHNGLFAFRAWWHNPAMPGNGYALMVFDAVTNEFIENSEIIVNSPDANYKYDPQTEKYILMDKEEVDQRISETRSKWIRLLDRYRIIGKIENVVEEITTENYQSFTDADFEFWFDYDIYGEYPWDEEIHWSLIAGMGDKQKIIAQRKDISDVISAGRILGYYQSPYDNKIVLVTVIAGRGWYEDRIAIGYNLYGFDMDEFGE